MKNRNYKKRDYNVRIVDNHDGTVTIGFVTVLGPVEKTSDGNCRMWRTSNKREFIRLLKKSEIV